MRGSILFQIFYLLIFYAFGELVSILIERFIPGSVLGMLFLFFALKKGILREGDVADASLFLTKNMGVFFIPAGVGLITQLDLLKQHWFPIALAMVISSILVLAVVASLQQWLGKKSSKY